MNAEKQISDFINKQKQIAADVNMKSRIMSKIESENGLLNVNSVSLWQVIAVAASIVLVIFTGVRIGNTYHHEKNQNQVLIINDASIENLHVYNSFYNE